MGSPVCFSKDRGFDTGTMMDGSGYNDDGRSMVSFVDNVIRPEDSISMVGMNRPPTIVGGMAPSNITATLGSRLQTVAGPPVGPRPIGHDLLVKLQEADGTFYRLHCVPEDGWQMLRSSLQSRLFSEAPLRAVLYPDDDGGN